VIGKGEEFDNVPRVGSESGSRPGEHRAVGAVRSERVVRCGDVLSDLGEVVGNDVGYSDSNVARVGVEDRVGVVVHSGVGDCPGDVERSARLDVGRCDDIDHDQGVFEVRGRILR